MSRVLSNAINQITCKYNYFTNKGVNVMKYNRKVAEVIAHSDGTVVEADSSPSYGNFIRIQHINGYSTFYAYLSHIAVVKGSIVKQGDVIGSMGNSGNAKETCLHFEVWNSKGRKINPTRYLDADLPLQKL